MVFLVLAQAAEGDTYRALLAGKSCKERGDQQVDCNYKIAKILHISIAGVGLKDTGIAFLKSDIDADYWGKFGMLHRCVIVKGPGLADYAFISPKNGKIYKDWPNCRNQK